MKKLKLLVMPLMVVSLLMSCGKSGGGGDNPEPKPISFYNVTFDAGDGTYPTGESSFSLELPEGTKLLPIIRHIGQPNLTNQTFTYYEYKGENNVIDYDDVVTNDITLKANYSDSSTEPTDDLTEFDWKTIKNIAVTGDPSRWFKIGATKTVKVNGKDHEVRIIDFAHDGDITVGGYQTGITFEFFNLISDGEGSSYTTIWDDNSESFKDVNNYDYRESFLNNFLNNETKGAESVINMLPSDSVNKDLKEVIEPVDKKVGVSINKDKQYEALSFGKNKYPKLFPLSYDEIDGQPPREGGVVEGEGSKYQYYIDHSDISYRVKKSVGGFYWQEYWLRSPVAIVQCNAWIVDTDGSSSSSSNVLVDEFAIAPAFCL